MKLYNFAAPNPWRVRAYLMEKGVEIPLVEVNAMEGATRTPEFLKIIKLHYHSPLGKKELSKLQLEVQACTDKVCLEPSTISVPVLTK